MSVRVQAFWVLWAASLGAAAFFAVIVRFQWRRGRLNLALSSCSVALLTALLAARWVVSGHPPLFGAFENALLASWSAAVAVLVTRATAPVPIQLPLERALTPVPPAILLAGLLFDSTPTAMGAAERVWLGYVHGVTGWLGFAVLVAATVVAGRVLQARDDATSPLWDWYLFRVLCVGFVGLTATIASGSLYSLMLFSDWYRWQIVETLAAAIWIAYSLVLHARLFFRWKGRQLAWATISIAPLLLSAYWIWAVFPGTYHYFGRLIGA